MRAMRCLPRFQHYRIGEVFFTRFLHPLTREVLLTVTFLHQISVRILGDVLCGAFTLGLPSEGSGILTGEKPVMVEAMSHVNRMAGG